MGVMAHPLIITASLAPQDFAWADGLRRAHFPPERNQVPAHIALIHHLPPARLHEVKRLLVDLARESPPSARVDGVMRFQSGVALRIHAPLLDDMRAYLVEIFARDLLPVDRAMDHLHITIQNKATSAQARALHATLSAELEPRRLAISGLGIWGYDDGKWVAITNYAFRG